MKDNLKTMVHAFSDNWKRNNNEIGDEIEIDDENEEVLEENYDDDDDDNDINDNNNDDNDDNEDDHNDDHNDDEGDDDNESHETIKVKVRKKKYKQLDATTKGTGNKSINKNKNCVHQKTGGSNNQNTNDKTLTKRKLGNFFLPFFIFESNFQKSFLLF